MRWKFEVFFATILCVMPAYVPVFAHHGTAAYDTTTPVTIRGTVTKFVWANPHVRIFLDVKDDKGNITHWSTETYSPGKLVKIGWTKNSIKPGDQVAITCYPAKDGSLVGFALKLVFADGRELRMTGVA